jgi:hypothetical protein
MRYSTAFCQLIPEPEQPSPHKTLGLQVVAVPVRELFRWQLTAYTGTQLQNVRRCAASTCSLYEPRMRKKRKQFFARILNQNCRKLLQHNMHGTFALVSHNFLKKRSLFKETRVINKMNGIDIYIYICRCHTKRCKIFIKERYKRFDFNFVIGGKVSTLQ